MKQLEKINPHVAPPDLTLYNNAKAIMASHNLSHCNKYSIYIIVKTSVFNLHDCNKTNNYQFHHLQLVIFSLTRLHRISKFSQGLILISWHLGIVTNVESWQSGIMTMWHRVTNHWNVWLNPNAPGWHWWPCDSRQGFCFTNCQAAAVKISIADTIDTIENFTVTIIIFQNIQLYSMKPNV